jgi:hypothetical protein
LRDLWELLGWAPHRGEFSFVQNGSKVFLSIDLDCFVIRWKEYLLPWVQEVYEEEFLTASTYSSINGWTGKRF